MTKREDSGSWVVSRVGREGFRTEVIARSHRSIADEPVALGGTDTGPTPYEYLLMALGACTAMTLRMYADRKGWPLERAEVSLRQMRSHAEDCERCATESVGIERIERYIELEGSLSDEQKKRLLAVAERCPVKQTLAKEIRVETATSTQ
ncbi:MAG TPA: OsmC family protein [Gemmatimonadaceae bacterium]|nr:OsmC family protein [Gemmatimonadaceae bacterium]